jgi:hypothetical protein
MKLDWMKRIGLVVLLLFFVQGVWAQIELGQCDQPYDDKVEKQVNKAVTSFNKKDYKMTRIYINNVLEVQPKNAHALYLMGELSIREKNIVKTEAYWTQLMNVCPD